MNPRRILITTTLAALAAVTTLSAQPRGGGGGGSRLDYLAGYLSLTDAQKAQAQTIFDAANTASTTASGALTAARTALDNAVKASAADAELDRLSAALGAVEGQLAAIRAKSDVKFRAILTAEQKTKLDAVGGSGGRGPMGFRGGRRPGGD